VDCFERGGSAAVISNVAEVWPSFRTRALASGEIWQYMPL
jgi:hypothetical protein